MDTRNIDATFWVAGYTDYLRDVVGAADTTSVRYLPTVQRGADLGRPWPR